MSIVIDNPRSFFSNIDAIVQVGVELAPYAISRAALIVMELIKKGKKIRIKFSEDGFEVEGEPEKVLGVVDMLIKQREDEKAKKLLEELLSRK